MNTALKYLNFMVDGTKDPDIPSVEDAREAIRVIELFPIAAGALRTLLKYPGDKEGIEHARRCIMHLEESEARARKRLAEKFPPATIKAATAAPQPPVADSVDDLA